MKYTQLTPEYRYDTLAKALLQRETEHFHYDFDRANFETLLRIMPDGPMKDDVAIRLQQTLEQMQFVEKIYEALLEQVDDQEMLAAAIERLRAQVCQS